MLSCPNILPYNAVIFRVRVKQEERGERRERRKRDDT
jgi:hypothetical protein